MLPMLEACAAICVAIGMPDPAIAIAPLPDAPLPIAPLPTGPAIEMPAPASSSVVLSDEELSEFRGGQSIVVTNQTLVSVTAGNVLNGDYAAGAVTLTDNALQGFNGIGNLLINTGAQVSLQTGMNLTINLINP